MERNSQPRFSERLNRTSLTEHARSGGYQHVLTAVRVHRVRHEAIHWSRTAPVEAVRQDGVDHGAFKETV